ncbi:hypothetical protein BU17DRAFT_100260 [Hysterangium stoloniferum]|nr:hypothetical protein BU17DRAFT_100260 [Hysterangium stoloniferum]
MEGHQDSTWTRYLHKFKQQPLIPIGVAATCVAFVGATRRLRSGDRASFNRQAFCLMLILHRVAYNASRWLRFRVIAQGFTVAAAVIGGWQIAQDRKAARQQGLTPTTEEEQKMEKEAAERRRFEARMKEAEEAHRLETGGKAV